MGVSHRLSLYQKHYQIYYLLLVKKNKSQLQKDGQFKMLFGYPTDEDKYPSVIVGD